MYFDEMTLGQSFSLPPVTVGKEQALAFARELDPQPLHLDEAYANRTGFGGLVAPGVLSAMLVWAEFVKLGVLEGGFVAGRSTKVEWMSPVYPGDRLTGTATVTDLAYGKRFGTVQVTILALNQDDKAVLRHTTELAMRSRVEAPPPVIGLAEADRERFRLAAEVVMGTTRLAKGIGTLQEKTLHAVLKRYMEPSEDNHEIRIGPYVADIVGEDGIIEIQTRGFNTMRGKLEAFLAVARVTIVHPIPHTKWLAWVDPETGEASPKRKSPKQGSFYQAFPELYKIRGFLTHPNLMIRLMLVDMEEYRTLTGWSRDKKKGSTRYERIPVNLVDELAVGGAVGYSALVPRALPPTFTSRDYHEASGLPQYDAQTALNVLHAVGAVRRLGKRERMHVYERA